MHTDFRSLSADGDYWESPLLLVAEVFWDSSALSRFLLGLVMRDVRPIIKLSVARRPVFRRKATLMQSTYGLYMSQWNYLASTQNHQHRGLQVTLPISLLVSRCCLEPHTAGSDP